MDSGKLILAALIAFHTAHPPAAGASDTEGTVLAPSPRDLEWLRRDCGDGALVHHAAGKLYLTELATGTSVFLAPGNQPEFSPDSSKLAWIDGTVAKGRMRAGDSTIWVIAPNVEPSGGVHWLSNDEVAVVLQRGGRKAWYRVSLGGTVVELPGLTRLGTGGYECDVRLGRDGVWSYVAKQSWRTSDGGRGTLPGTCSVSLSPDGRSVTSLHNPHKECTITAVRPGGLDSTLWWPYEGGFDNHRWSSNDPRFIVAVDEHHQTMAVMTPDGAKVTRMGTLGRAKHGMYGDFTVGEGRGEPWPGTGDRLWRREPAWPPNADGLFFVWDHAQASNTVVGGDGEVALCQVQPRGRARFTRYFAMDVRGGSFEVGPERTRAAIDRWRRSGELTVEVTVTAGAEVPGTAPILTASGANGRADFVLAQQGRDLVWSQWHGRGESSAELFPVEIGRRHHVVLTWRGGRMASYRDGERRVHRELAGDPGSWTARRLIFGGAEDGPGWPGAIEGVALYERALDADEVRQHHQGRTVRPGERRPTPRLVVEAVLLEKRSIPKPEAYPQTLVVYDYRVVRVETGGYSSEKLLVAHWGNLNGATVDETRRRVEGKTYRLVLERFDEHPQLAGLQIIDNLEDLDIPVYYDVELPGGWLIRGSGSR